MQVVHARCCGLDVHQKTVVACILITHSSGQVEKQVHTFGTMTSELLALDEWLQHWQIDHVALESTGVYWKPVFNLLEDGRTIVLVNPQHMKAVPGRKTDIKDAEWIADLFRHGLLKASFIPPQPIRELRELTRYRKTLVQERTREVQRLHKVLESANVKLAVVATDVLGKSGRDMLDAIIQGEQDPYILAGLARGRLREKLPALHQALAGRVHPHHQVLLTHLLAHIDFLEQMMATLQQEIDALLAPFAEAVTLLQTIPGIGEQAASAIVSEIGTDMERFPSAKHLASWAGLCPGNRQSGGKRLKGKITQGDPWIRAILGQVAWAIAHTKNNYLVAFYQRLARRRGKYKAITALEHRVLVIIYHVLQLKRPYTDLGADYFDHLEADRLQRHHVHRLEQLGYAVTLAPIAQVS